MDEQWVAGGDFTFKTPNKSRLPLAGGNVRSPINTRRRTTMALGQHKGPLLSQSDLDESLATKPVLVKSFYKAGAKGVNKVRKPKPVAVSPPKTNRMVTRRRSMAIPKAEQKLPLLRNPVSTVKEELEEVAPVVGKGRKGKSAGPQKVSKKSVELKSKNVGGDDPKSHSTVTVLPSPVKMHATPVPTKLTPLPLQKSLVKSDESYVPVSASPVKNGDESSVYKKTATVSSKVIRSSTAKAEAVKTPARTKKQIPVVSASAKVKLSPSSSSTTRSRRSVPNPAVVTEMVKQRSQPRKRTNSVTNSKNTPVKVPKLERHSPKKIVRKATPTRKPTPSRVSAAHAKRNVTSMLITQDDSLLFSTPDVEPQVRRAGTTPYHTPLAGGKLTQIQSAGKHVTRKAQPTSLVVDKTIALEESVLSADESLISEDGVDAQATNDGGDTQAAAGDSTATKSWCRIM